MSKTFAIAGLAVALVFGALPVHAAGSMNGTAANALSNNAGTLNALSNNAAHPTSTPNHGNLGTETGLRIVAVELPATR